MGDGGSKRWCAAAPPATIVPPPANLLLFCMNYFILGLFNSKAFYTGGLEGVAPPTGNVENLSLFDLSEIIIIDESIYTWIV